MFSLTLTANSDALEQIAQSVLSLAQQAKLDSKTTYQLRLAIDEIATNIISYAYADTDKKGIISFSADINEHQVILYLEDIGIPFNPLKASPPNDLNQPLEDRKIGGLGIYLVLQSVDQFMYERVGDRNRNILIINRG